MSYALLLLLAAIALLALIPTRRLFLAGWSRGALTAYFLALVALGLVVAELRAPARFLIPILVVVYIAPFVTARAGFDRLLGRVRDRGAIVIRPAETRQLPSPDDTPARSAEPERAAGEPRPTTGEPEDAAAPTAPDDESPGIGSPDGDGRP